LLAQVIVQPTVTEASHQVRSRTFIDHKPCLPLLYTILEFNDGNSGGEWSAALDLLETMPLVGLQPTTVSYNAALAACASAQQHEAALQLFAEMTATDTSSSSSSSSSAVAVKPDKVTYNTLIACLAKAQQCQQALPLLQVSLFPYNIA
jgi:pentatricopeptide repeat protein